MKRMRRTFVPAAVVAVAAGLLPGLVAAAPAHAADPPVHAFPAPGEHYASPDSGITLRGADASGVTVHVSGSVSGEHTGTLRANSDGHGSTFTPSKPFAPGEQVTVRTDVPVQGGSGESYTFTVARPVAESRRPPDAADATPDATQATPDAASACTPGLPGFRSRPDLAAPGACVNIRAHGTAPGYLFMAPKASRGHGGGPTIYDEDGHLIWYQGSGGKLIDDVKVIGYNGRQVLAYFDGANAGGHGEGEYTLLNDHYTVIGHVRSVGYQTDLHELVMSSPTSALVGAYNAVTRGGKQIYDYVVQEIDIPTGAVLWEWHALDHIATSLSRVPAPTSGIWDYFHGNSIGLTHDGNVLISSRNTWGVYKINRITGAVLWHLGKGGDFALRPAGSSWFCYQHDAREQANGNIGLFDDGGSGPGCRHHARGLSLRLDQNAKTATIVSNLHHSPELYADFVGSRRTMSNGDQLVSWGNSPYVTEFKAGTPNFDMRISGMSYRVVRARWTGLPDTKPSIAATRSRGTVTVWASWNGATEVARWRLVAGSSASSLHAVGSSVPKVTFDTRISASTNLPYVAAQALGASGQVLATSPVKAPTTGTSVGITRVRGGRLKWAMSDSTRIDSTDHRVYYGVSGDIPVTGDWDGNGTTTPGIVRVMPDGRLKWALSNSTTSGRTDYRVYYGHRGDIPVTGDWDGHGGDSIGIARRKGGVLHWGLSNSLRHDNQTDYRVDYGIPGDRPVTGDWDGHRGDSIGIARPEGNALHWGLSNRLRRNNVTDYRLDYGVRGDRAVTGDWDGHGGDSIGIARPEGSVLHWGLSNSLRRSNVTAARVDTGLATDVPVTGNWDGN